jgi:hypothetical protein
VYLVKDLVKDFNEVVTENKSLSYGISEMTKNNSKLIILNTKNNPNLSQICVNNVAAAMAIEEWEKDTFTNYSVNCN